MSDKPRIAHLAGANAPLRKLIETDQIPSMIFWGPPGSGKTTLARVIANTTQSRFVFFSAVTSGVKEVRAIIARAAEEKKLGRRTILFVDEIHRFNRAQQDAFLPHVENGTIVLIGATTENPSFEVNAALLSRARVFVLNALESTRWQGLLLTEMRRAAIHGQLGNRAEAQASLAELEALDPDFASHARRDLEKFYLEDALVEHFLEGLRKAGLEVPAG